MKTMFDENVRKELILRVSLLSEKSTRQWGKMNVYQMTKHCTVWNEWVLGKNDFVFRQSLLGFVFGKMALKSQAKDDRPMKKGMPAGKGFTIAETSGDLELQKQRWIECITGYANFSNTEFVHDFFGKMTKEEIGIFAYKHADHHLRQFGC